MNFYLDPEIGTAFQTHAFWCQNFQKVSKFRTLVSDDRQISEAELFDFLTTSIRGKLNLEIFKNMKTLQEITEFKN